MADPVTVDVSGLQLSNNTFSASPPGSLWVAQNCVMPQKGVIEPRRGQSWLSSALPMSNATTQVPLSLIEFQGTLIANVGTSKLDTSQKLGKYGSAAFSGTFNPVDTTASNAPGRMRFGFGNAFLHFCTTVGAKTLESTSATPRWAGVQQMVDPLPTMSNAAGGFLPYNYSVAYRTVLKVVHSDGTSSLGPPSSRATVTNKIQVPAGGIVRNANVVTVTVPENPVLGVLGLIPSITPGEAGFPAGPIPAAVATEVANVFTYAHVAANATSTATQDFDTGARAVNVKCYLPPNAAADNYVRIYRGLYTTGTPSDEMFLVAELKLAAGDITAGYINYTDLTPQSVLVQPLYTNPNTGEGIAQANYSPPMYRDLAYFNDRMFYGNITSLKQLTYQILGVGSPDGIQNNDTFSPNGVHTATFKTVPVGADDIQIYSLGTPSQNIERTTRALCQWVNTKMASVSSTIRAFYLSSTDDSPGIFMLQDMAYDTATSFTASASRYTSFSPPNSQTASHITVPNQLFYSKLGQSEAVPLLNYLSVGAKNYPIARVMALQNALLVFKKGDGVYSVTGQYPFQVQQISTANLLATDCCAVFADACWAYTDQGIVRISDSGGATVISRPIETELNRLANTYADDTANYAFAVPYEIERRILFFVPSAAPINSRPSMSAYCYNNATQSWTGPLYENIFSGVVSPSTAKLILGQNITVPNGGGYNSFFTQERKGNNDHRDYADQNWDISVTFSEVRTTGTIITATTVYDIEAGDVIVQGATLVKVKAKRTDLGSNYYELYEATPLNYIATATVYKRINVALQFQPFGNPTARKALSRLTWLLKPEWYLSNTGTTLLQTDQAQENLSIASPALGYGQQPYGLNYGGKTPQTLDVNPIAPSHAMAAQFYPGLSISEAYFKFKLQGYSYAIDSMSAPGSRSK